MKNTVLTAVQEWTVKAMAEYVVGLTGYVIVEADSDEEAIDNALSEIPDEMEAEIIEVHYEPKQ